MCTQRAWLRGHENLIKFRKEKKKNADYDLRTILLWISVLALDLAAR